MTGGHWEKAQKCNSNFLLLCTTDFEALCDETSSVDDQYNAFVEAHRLTAEEILPVSQKPKQQKYQNHPEIVKARKKVDQLTKRYITQKFKVVRKHLKEAKEFLQQQYELVDCETLRRQIADVEIDFQSKNQPNEGFFDLVPLVGRCSDLSFGHN